MFSHTDASQFIEQISHLWAFRVLPIFHFLKEHHDEHLYTQMTFDTFQVVSLEHIFRDEIAGSEVVICLKTLKPR